MIASFHGREPSIFEIIPVLVLKMEFSQIICTGILYVSKEQLAVIGAKCIYKHEFKRKEKILKAPMFTGLHLF